tara:strand:- start:368 stop:586 length:219 start_codon:yes stop_codon:yes gene_type:complete
MSDVAIDADQTARIVALESLSQDHSTRIRTIEDAVLSLSTSMDIIGKAAKVVVIMVGLGLGVNVGEFAGVMD